MPRQLFSLSNIKFKNYFWIKKVKELEEFDSQITSAYEARDKYEKRMAEIFPDYVKNNVSYNRRRLDLLLISSIFFRVIFIYKFYWNLKSELKGGDSRK